MKIPNLSKKLQESYKLLIQDIEWTIGEFSFEYDVETQDVEEDSAHVIIKIKDRYEEDNEDKVKYYLEFIIYENSPTKIHRYEDMWDDEDREKIWENLFFQADKLI